MLLEALFSATWRRAFLLIGQGQAADLACLNCGQLFSCPQLRQTEGEQRYRNGCDREMCQRLKGLSVVIYPGEEQGSSP